jgi:hypothetical protein
MEKPGAVSRPGANRQFQFPDNRTGDSLQRKIP